MLQTCLPSHCLPCLLILKASGKLSEEALFAHAQKGSEPCISPKYEVPPDKIHTDIPIHIHTKLCLDALRAGRCHIWLLPHCHQLSVMAGMDSSSPPNPSWWITADPAGRKAMDIIQPWAPDSWGLSLPQGPVEWGL